MMLLVMLFDRTCGIATVYRNSDRKMPQPPNYLLHKGIQAAFTKTDDEPTSFTLTRSEGDLPFDSYPYCPAVH
jgi:hypothetical protein